MKRREFLRASTAALLVSGSGLQARADTGRDTPPPAALPMETEAVRGRHSLHARAHKHGLLVGATGFEPATLCSQNRSDHLWKPIEIE